MYTIAFTKNTSTLWLFGGITNTHRKQTHPPASSKHRHKTENVGFSCLQATKKNVPLRVAFFRTFMA